LKKKKTCETPKNNNDKPTTTKERLLFQRVRATAYRYSPATKYNFQKTSPYLKTRGQTTMTNQPQLKKPFYSRGKVQHFKPSNKLHF
jgi:hypothetical protein